MDQSNHNVAIGCIPNVMMNLKHHKAAKEGHEFLGPRIKGNRMEGGILLDGCASFNRESDACEVQHKLFREKAG